MKLFKSRDNYRYGARKQGFSIKEDILRDPSCSFRSNMDYDEFSRKMLNQALSRIIHDSMIPIEIVSKEDRLLNEMGSSYFQLGNTFEKNLIFKESKTLREIVIESLYSKVDVFKVQIAHENYFFTDLTVPSDGSHLVEIGSKKYPILKAYSLEKPILDKELLLAPFKILYNFYLQIDLCYQKGHTVFFKKHNFNAMMDAIKDPQRYEDLLNQAAQTYDDFFNGKGGIIDSQDTFEVPSISVDGLKDAMNFVYSELSRMLGVPRSELLGESPTGLNSGGVLEFQRIGYERRLNDYRKRFIEPLLQNLGVEYCLSGLNGTEKLALLKDFSGYAKDLFSLDPHLYNISLTIVNELLGDPT